MAFYKGKNAVIKYNYLIYVLKTFFEIKIFLSNDRFSVEVFLFRHSKSIRTIRTQYIHSKRFFVIRLLKNNENFSRAFQDDWKERLSILNIVCMRYFIYENARARKSKIRNFFAPRDIRWIALFSLVSVRHKSMYKMGA